MRLSQALEIVQRGATETGEPFTVWLACGCEPLHLRTFLAAELMERLARAPVEVHTGFFDDLAGNIERASDAGDDPVAVVVEWPDLDPRLGLRRLGGWRPDQLDDIVTQTRTALERLERSVLAAAGGRRVVCVMPTLTLPPLFPQPPRQSGPHELALRAMAAGTAARLSSEPGVSMVSHQRLDSLSPPATRRDVKAELAAGFPYSLDHASAVAALLAELLCPPVPRKGLITDLDDTLWAGLLDEAGPQDVSWTGDDHRHALYQQLLASLAGAGVLIGVASRNDPGLVAEALARADLLVGRDALYPVEVTWGAKSHSVRSHPRDLEHRRRCRGVHRRQPARARRGARASARAAPPRAPRRRRRHVAVPRTPAGAVRQGRAVGRGWPAPREHPGRAGTAQRTRRGRRIRRLPGRSRRHDRVPPRDRSTRRVPSSSSARPASSTSTGSG